MMLFWSIGIEGCREGFLTLKEKGGKGEIVPFLLLSTVVSLMLSLNPEGGAAVPTC